MAREKKRGPKLPVQQLVILATVRVAEPLALTSVFPYLPEMIKSFGVPLDQVAKWAGFTSAMFSISQSMTAVPWGWTSDSIGRKPTIITGLICTMICFLFWGSSTSLFMAITVRGIQGASNGNVGTIRTMVAEMVPQKSLQARAFSIMPMVWSVGSVFGPSFGGFFARPAEQFPGLFGNSEFFKKYPYLLPNLVACVFFIFSTLCAFLFLEETLETKKYKRDWGLELGERLTRVFRRGKPSQRSLRRARARSRAEDRTRRRSFVDDEASAPLLSTEASRSEADLSLGGAKPPTAADALGAPDTLANPSSPSKPAGIFTYQIMMSLVSYTFLAFHFVAHDQVLPVFLNYPYEKHDASNTKLPFKFSGGFGLSSGSIGTIFTIIALITSFAQFVVFPPLCARFGPLRCYRFGSILLPFVYMAMPYTVLLENERLRYAAFIAVFSAKGVIGIVTFPCVTILLTNSAPSVRVLGTLNGYATLVSGLGRAAGPAMTGAIFTWGVQHGYIIAGWAFLSLVAIAGAVVTFFLQEGAGLETTIDDEAGGGDDEELEDEQFDSESGIASYGYATDDEDDGYEESLLREVDEDDDEDYYNNSVSSGPRTTASGGGGGGRQQQQWTSAAADTPLPAPAASLFEPATDEPPSPSLQRRGGPLPLPKLQSPLAAAGSLREPEDLGSDDPDAPGVVGLGLELDGSAPPSPVRTRTRFRSASSLSRRGGGREDSRGAAASNPVALSPVVPPPSAGNSNTEREE